MAGRCCLLVWGDAEETKGNGRRRWRGVGPAGRPSLFPFGVSVILKQKEEEGVCQNTIETL